MGKLQVKRRPSKSPQIGDMRERVELFSRAMTEPVFGTASFTELYTSLGTVWAKVETIIGEERFDDVAPENKPTDTFTIRFRSDVTTETRLLYKGDYYQIIDPNNSDKRNGFLFLKCKNLGDKDFEANQ